MKTLLLSLLLLFAVSASAQEIAYKRVDALYYQFWIKGAEDVVKYQWTFEAPPDYAPKLVLSKQDTICYRFPQAGFVSVYARYKKEGENWCEDLSLNFNVK